MIFRFLSWPVVILKYFWNNLSFLFWLVVILNYWQNKISFLYWPVVILKYLWNNLCFFVLAGCDTDLLAKWNFLFSSKSKWTVNADTCQEKLVAVFPIPAIWEKLWEPIRLLVAAFPIPAIWEKLAKHPIRLLVSS